jgi:hypothetical protein
LAGKDCFEGNVVAWSQVFKPHDDWILSVPGPLVSIAILDHPDLVLAVEGFRPMAEVTNASSKPRRKIFEVTSPAA